MIVPKYWAEGRLQHRHNGKRFTVRRFGWSDASPEEAQANADTRTQEAMQRMISGEKLALREPKIPYNGAQGVPIREEIVDRRGEAVVTRTTYGARCLNTPNVLFVDIDEEIQPSLRFVFSVFAVLVACAVSVIVFSHSRALGGGLIFFGLFFSGWVSRGLYRVARMAQGGFERMVRKRLEGFLARHPEWNVRVYRTPAGMRLLATHRTFDPNEPAVAECFEELGADPVYVRMCMNQQCFRARVSPKPWRIGIGEHMRPRPGVWPVRPERMAVRNAWIERYEAAATSFASCRFVNSAGSGGFALAVREVQEWHDELCQANSQFPIA